MAACDSGGGLSKYFRSHRLETLSHHIEKPRFPVFGDTAREDTGAVSWVTTPNIKVSVTQDLKPAKTIAKEKLASQPVHFGSVARKQRSVDGALLYNGLENVNHGPKASGGQHCVNLFFYLWAPNGKGNSCPLVQIPDTLIIQKGSIRFWFFTDKKNQLKKKNQERLEDWRNVLSSLSRSQSNAKGSAAGPFHRKAIHVAHVDKQNSGDEGVKFTYLEQKELKDLLAVHLGALPDGVLQKFVGQTGEIQTVYLVHWQEVLFRASQLVMNISGNISRDRLPKGPVPVILQTRLQEICDSIVQHVYEVSPQKYRIDSMKLYFKKDHLGGLRLLFCSELRVTKLCDRTSKTIVKIRNYNPVVTPQYFNHSHSVETCTSVIRRGTTQRNVSLGLSPRRTASASVSASLEIPSTPSEKLANTIGSAIPKGVSAFKLVLKQKRSPTPEAAVTSDIQSERIGIGSILRSNGGSPRKLDTSFSKPRIRSADGEIGAKRRESLMTHPAPETPSTDVRPASAPIRSTTVLSKRTPQTKGNGAPASKPLDLGSILEEKKKKCRSTSDQVHDLSLMEYHQWLGKSRPQRAIHTKQNAEALPHLLVFEVGEEHKDAVRSQASDNRVPMSKRNEDTVPCSRMHHTYPKADKGVSSQRVSKRKDVSSTYNVKKTPEENADKDGLAEYKEFVRAQYAFFHESEHVHRMKLQMQIAERDITISGLKSDLIEQKAELCDLRRRREK